VQLVLRPLTSISDYSSRGWRDALAVALWLAECATATAHEQEVLRRWAPLAAVLHVAVAQVTVVCGDDQACPHSLPSDQQEQRQSR